jgi:hypothetical protein
MTNELDKGDRVIIRFGFGVTELIHLVVQAESDGRLATTACRLRATKKKSKERPSEQVDTRTRKPATCLWCIAQVHGGPLLPELW